MDIHYKLFKHQKELLACTQNMVYLRAGRGSGKSYIASLIAVITLLKEQRVICLGQNFKAVSEVLMRECIIRLNEILPPGSFNVNKALMKITYKKGTIYFASYENLDAIRGYSQIYLAICDEAALADEYLMTTLPFCMRDLNGVEPRIIFISTPRSNNWLTAYVRKEGIKVINAKTSDNTKVTPEEIAIMKRGCLSETAWQREFYGIEVDDDNNGTLFSMTMLEDAPVNGTTYAIGVDCSGLGKDFNVIVLRQGNCIKRVEKFETASGRVLYNCIRNMINEFGIDNLSHICIDMAYGQSLYDVLMETEYAQYTSLVPFGGGSDDPAFLNKRAQMYVKLKKFIEEHGINGLNEDIKNELCNTKYCMTNHDKVALIPKEDIKAVIGRSPDSADALVLTMAEDDIPKGLRNSRREEIKRRLM